MKVIASFSLLLIIIYSVWFYFRHKLFNFYQSKLQNIKKANSIFSKRTNLKNGYFTNYQLTLWKNQQTNLFNEISGKPFNFINLSIENIKAIKTFKYYFNNAASLRNDFNKKFIIEELKTYSSFFDNIENRKLDIQQRTAVVTDEDNNIVIAGAGSGKTTTIVGKVNYILKRYKVSPAEILLISFTNKSASTLGNRIDIKGIQAKTFHKFGIDIIVEAEGKKPSIFESEQFEPLIKKYFNELKKDAKYLEKVTDYFINYLKPPKPQFDFENQGDYIQYMKGHNFKSYKLKELQTNGRITYKMEVVKSIEECKIANFLLFNGVNYEYEYPYEYATATLDFRQYKPDFTIIQNGKKIYLEHFGISRNGNVPDWFTSNDKSRTASEKYRDDMNWKRNIHKSNGTILIESYSYEMSEDILFDNLKNNLESVGVILKPKSPNEIWEIISQAAVDEVKSFITLFGTFITLLKSNNYSIDDVLNKNKQTQDAFFKDRNDLFIEIIEPILKLYQNHLKERNEIDFSDMINIASRYIANGKHKQKYSYIIVDEFQDISIGRYQLLKAIKNNNPSCKLYCVGDDWQSIYRFTGSDIALFKDFEKYFGFTVSSKIESTYRFSNPLLSLSSDFILKNPNQVKKELKGISTTLKTNFEIKYLTTDEDDTIALKEIFDELLESDEKIESKEIIILGRYSFDIARIINANSAIKVDNRNEVVSYVTTSTDKKKTIKAKYMTVHKAKGLEADIVIILNCNSGKYGFPSEMSDDQVLNLLLSEADQFENGEERRLFYVAMTRAKECVYFVSDSSYKSKFISELEVESGQSFNVKCPQCKTGDIVLRKTGKTKKGDLYKFYGCTNYLYGCDYTTTEWINENTTNIYLNE